MKQTIEVEVEVETENENTRSVPDALWACVNVLGAVGARWELEGKQLQVYDGRGNMTEFYFSDF